MHLICMKWSYPARNEKFSMNAKRNRLNCWQFRFSVSIIDYFIRKLINYFDALSFIIFFRNILLFGFFFMEECNGIRIFLWRILLMFYGKCEVVHCFIRIRCKRINTHFHFFFEIPKQIVLYSPSNLFRVFCPFE